VIFALLASIASAAIPADSAQAILQIEAERLPPLALSTYIESKDPEVRARAARALGRLRSTGALVPLARLAADPDPGVRIETAFALGQTPDTERTLLGRLAIEKDPDVRAALFEALGKVGTSASKDALIAGLSEKPELFRPAVVAESAAIGIGRLGQRKVAPFDDGKSSAVQAAVPPLLDQLARLDVRAARGAAFALYRLKVGAVDTTSAARWIAAARSHGDAVVRDYLVRGLASWPSPERIAVLEGAMKDSSPGVRAAAAKVGGEIAWQGVADMLGDSNHAVRVQAIQSVGAMPGLDRKLLLSPIVKEGAPDEAAEAIEALAAANLLDDPTHWLDPTFPELIRAAATSALHDTDRLRSMALDDPSAQVRTAAALRLVEEKPAKDTLLALLGGKDSVVAAIVSDHLREHPAAGTETALLDLADATDDPDLLSEVARALAATYEQKSAKPSERARTLAKRLSVHPFLPVREAAIALQKALAMPKSSAAGAHALMTTDLAAAQEIKSARIKTSRGTFVVALESNEAPITVASFAYLADAGFYDGRFVHRMVPDFVVQDGCPRGDGWGGPGYAIPDEVNRLHYDDGTVGMALSGPDTGGSQWFVTLSPQPHLDGTYTIFGHVTQGMQVVRALRRGDEIESIDIERVGPIGIPPLTVAASSGAGNTTATAPATATAYPVPNSSVGDSR
jgi:cyclophilin family peptidyl-prolyl cis-trans isomerase/HEAT repeat protein